MAQQEQQEQQVQVLPLAVQVVEHHINPLNITPSLVTATNIPMLVCMPQEVIQEVLE
jgi:hypothetical protein